VVEGAAKVSKEGMSRVRFTPTSLGSLIVGSGKLELELMAVVFEDRPALRVGELFNVTLSSNFRRGPLRGPVWEGAREDTCKYVNNQ
jgi:hypothetical protein